MEQAVDNSIYDTYGDRWYTAQDDPIALLRAESKVKTPWVFERIVAAFPGRDPKSIRILDVGCGGGFLSNALAVHGFSVMGIDLSAESLEVARRHDVTRSVEYVNADACRLPSRLGQFDVVTSMDFLEHVEQPSIVVGEISRVLNPGGLFFFHTFNRNPLSGFVVIRLVEWFVKNTPKHMHVLRLFIKPSELKAYCTLAGLEVEEIVGIKPVFSSISLRSIFSGIVPVGMRFELTRSLLLSYMGVAKKRSL